MLHPNKRHDVVDRIYTNLIRLETQGCPFVSNKWLKEMKSAAEV